MNKQEVGFQDSHHQHNGTNGAANQQQHVANGQQNVTHEGQSKPGSSEASESTASGDVPSPCGNVSVFERRESEVRGYCRSFPAVFVKATGAMLYDECGNEYIDFFSGAGTLNYGHNDPVIKAEVMKYMESDGVVHGLDMFTNAKREFLETFEELILVPRNMNYKIQFPGPTGTNAVEAALKLARKIKGRTNVIAFTNGFHGMTLGAVAATGNSYYRDAAGIPLGNTTFMPYSGYLGEGADTLKYIRKILEDSSSGVDMPAAVLVETVQGEGGLNMASEKWLRGLQRLCRRFDMLLMIDDIQAGCGRTGTFFSFEDYGISPDVVLLSKSLSAYGLPMSIVLMKPELDEWKPGEHNGTFRGNNLAFTSATAALRHYWADSDLTSAVRQKGNLLRKMLHDLQCEYGSTFEIKGRGLMQGIEFKDADVASQMVEACFNNGLVIETSGSDGQVLKCMPSLTIEIEMLERGLEIIRRCLMDVVDTSTATQQVLDESESLVGLPK